MEEERLAFLRHQVDERKARDYEQRQKEIQDDLILEQNFLRQREKLRLEYEADLANSKAKEQRVRMVVL